MFVHCCHCTDCQRQTGSAFAINALIEASHVELAKGKPVPVSMKTDSGNPHDIYRCAKCQTALWSDYGRRKVMLFVRAGSLDRAAAVRPDVHIYTRSKLPWVRLPKRQGVQGLLQHEETLARREPEAPRGTGGVGCPLRMGALPVHPSTSSGLRIGNVALISELVEGRGPL